MYTYKYIDLTVLFYAQSYNDMLVEQFLSSITNCFVEIQFCSCAIGTHLLIVDQIIVQPNIFFATVRLC